MLELSALFSNEFSAELNAMKIFLESKLINYHGNDKDICRVTKVIYELTPCNISYRETELLTIHPIF
jgi:hypothetical protein